MATGMDYCVSEKRTPSRCDRILVHSADNISIKVLQHKGADLVDSSDHNALFATVELGYNPKKPAEPAWGYQNTSNNEAIARIAQNNENARAARKMEERKRGLGGWLFGKRRQTRKQKQNRRRTRKA
jgi:hypothetical protein